MRTEELKKLTEKEMELRRVYVEGLINLKMEEVDGLIKQGIERFENFKEGSVIELNRSYASFASIKRKVEELMDLTTELKDIDELVRENNGEFIF